MAGGVDRAAKRGAVVGATGGLLTKTEGLKTKINGPFEVCALSEWHVQLRTSSAVHDQPVNQFKVHRDMAARCTTVTDVLEDLLKHADMLPAAEPSSSPSK